MSINKMIRDIASEAQGWTPAKTGAGHIRWTHKDGATVFSPTTPSCYRAKKNLLAIMRRLLRQQSNQLNDNDSEKEN
jgi:hypothetical protein